MKQFRAAQFFVQEFFAIDAAISPLCLLDPMRKIDSVAREGEPEYFATGTVDGDACPKPRKKFQFFKGRQHDGLCQKIALEAQRFKPHIYLPGSVSTAASLGLLALGPAGGAASPGALKLLDGFLKVYSAAPALRSKHKDYLKV